MSLLSPEDSLEGLIIEDTLDGRMVIRSSIDLMVQRKFDNWYKDKSFTIPTQSETRKTKTVNWDAKRTAKCWKFFTQGAMVEDGRPVVRCVVCGVVLFHGSFFGTTPMTAHLKKANHIKKAKELVYGSGISEEEPSEEEILNCLKNR